MIKFEPNLLTASFNCIRDGFDGLGQTLIVASGIFEQHNGRGSHKSSASHFHWTDFGVPTTVLCLCCKLSSEFSHVMVSSMV